MSLGFWQIAIVVVLVVLLFGRGKISSLMGDVAKGIKSFYDTCWQVFKCLDSMPLLSIEDPKYLAKVVFPEPKLPLKK